MGTVYNDVVKRLKEERLSLSLSQDDMARTVHMTQSNYSKVELGLRRLSYSEVKYLCDSQLDVYYFLTGNRSSDKYVDMTSSCTYAELCCYLSIMYSLVVLRRGKWSVENWESCMGRMKYVPLMETQCKNKTGDVFLSLRQSMNYPQKKIADLLGVDIKKYRNLEKGRSMPDSELLWKVYDSFAISPVILLQDKKGLRREISILLETAEKEKDRTFFEIINRIGC